MIEPIAARLSRLREARKATMDRLAATKPHSAKRTLVSHQLMRITADVLRMEQKTKRIDANQGGQ